MCNLIWQISHRADQKARVIADRHYNRQKIGSPQFVPPGRCFVLRQKRAVWVTSWPFAQYVKHDWGGAWVNSLFRRQRGRQIASEMILDAVAATRWKWPEVPALGMISFVDENKVRKKDQPGRCYIEAGFKYVGRTKGGLLAFQMLPEDMPEAQPPLGEAMNFKEQARASIEQLEAAQKRVEAILNSGVGPTLIQQPNSFTEAIQNAGMQVPAARKTRSDKGTHKPKTLTDPDEIALRLELNTVRSIVYCATMAGHHDIAAKIQDQIIAQLQRRIDQLQKQK